MPLQRRPPREVRPTHQCAAATPATVLIMLQFKLDEAKKMWKDFSARAHDFLAEACPSQSQELRNAFLKQEVSCNIKRIAHIRKQLNTKGKQRAVQAIGDMFRHWNSDEQRTKRINVAREQGQDVSKEELGWQAARDSKKKRQQPHAQSSTSSPAPSSSSPTPTTTRTTMRVTTPTTITMTRTPWKEYELADGYNLHDDIGEVVPKLDITAPIATAEGYHFCSSEAASVLFPKYAVTGNSVSFIVPPYGKGYKEDMIKAIEQLSAESGGNINGGVDAVSLMVKDGKGGRIPLDVNIVHASASRPVMPPHAIDDGMICTSDLPELSMDMPKEEELQVMVLGPMCRELGLDTWWSKFAARPFPTFKDDLKAMLDSPSYKPRELRVRRDRRLTWRGEEMEGEKVTAYVKVPSHLIDEYLAKSGRRGMVIDRAARAADHAPRLAKVRLPTEWTIADAIAKLDKVSPELRKAARGFVPSARGYILRTLKHAEPDFVRLFTPELAQDLGDSLGMTPNSTWKITGVPARATKAMIIKTFATVSSAWPGWKVMPLRPVGQPTRGKANWILEAEADPPKRDVIIDKACIAIDRHIEPKRISARAAPWFRIKPAEASKDDAQTTRSIWAEEVDDDDDSFPTHREEAPVQTERPRGVDTLGSATTFDMDQHRDTDDENGEIRPSPPKGHRVAMANPKAAPRPRRLSMEEASGDQGTISGGGIDNQMAEMMKMMQQQQQAQAEENAKKDALIQQLHQTIASLQATILAMQQAFSQMPSHATQTTADA